MELEMKSMYNHFNIYVLLMKMSIKLLEEVPKKYFLLRKARFYGIRRSYARSKKGRKL